MCGHEIGRPIACALDSWMSKSRATPQTGTVAVTQWDRDSMIECYFRLGMTYKDILKSLAFEGFIISERHLASGGTLWRHWSAVGAVPGLYGLTWALRTWLSVTFNGIYGEMTWMIEQRREAMSQGQVLQIRELRAAYSLYYDHSKKHRNCMLHTLYLLFTAV